MRITRVHIQNFRCLRDLRLELDETTVLIGANNAGKTAILEAVRIALSRRWGQRGTGFTEYDVHCAGETHDPKTAPPVAVHLRFEEPAEGAWDVDMIQALDELVMLDEQGRNLVSLRVTCEWNEEKDSFEPNWQFLNADGTPASAKANRAMNLSGFFGYAPLFFLAALRDAADEFGPRSSLWGRLLKAVQIPDEVELEVKGVLDQLDAQLLAADPKLAEIATVIGQAAKVVIGQGEGGAKLRMLPMNTWDLLARAAVVLQNETARPWLPLDHHGQGLQSLSVIFLFQAAVFEQLKDDLPPGTEPIFLLEEPEAHLHPQAARTLWDRINQLPGQKVVTTHSPYFVQHVPLRNLRVVRLVNGESQVYSMPRSVVSALPWNESAAKLGAAIAPALVRDPSTGRLAATAWIDPKIGESLRGCYKDQDQEAVLTALAEFRHACRSLVTPHEEHELSFLGRRIRGEVFFATRWMLVEGQCEYVLVHAIGRALGFPLDRHGVAVIDFQNNGDADIYPALATAFGIPWWMVTDGDDEAEKFRAQLLKRGFTEADLDGRFRTLPKPHCLEDQLLADGHEALLREALAQATTDSALTCGYEDFVARLKKNNKVACVSRLALKVELDAALALKMPQVFVQLVQELQGGAA